MKKKKNESKGLFAFDNDIKRLTIQNDCYRQVLYHSPRSQLVVMSIPPAAETGEENQESIDKMLFIVRGKAESALNKRTREVVKHDVVFVPAGNLHNLTNTGRHDLKIFVIYSPPLYADGTIHRTAEDSFKAKREKFSHAWEQ